MSARGLDVCRDCAKVTGVTDDDQVARYWTMVFRRGEKPYTYLRTEAEMVDIVRRSFAKNHVYPYRLWVIESVEHEDGTSTDEMRKVDIT